MLFRSPRFQDFLEVNSEDKAASVMCKRLGISSRTELHGNHMAQMAFDDLVKEYKNWSIDDDPF